MAADLEAETLKCDGEQLGLLMADHTQLDWRPLLPSIQLLCLNVIGFKSGVFPVEGTEAVSQLIPGATQECDTMTACQGV